MASVEGVDGEVLNFRPYGLPFTIVSRKMEGEELVWHYPGFGETRLNRICDLPDHM